MFYVDLPAAIGMYIAPKKIQIDPNHSKSFKNNQKHPISKLGLNFFILVQFDFGQRSLKNWSSTSHENV